MTSLIDGIARGEEPAGRDPRFPHAPEGWTADIGTASARAEGIEPEADHWDTMRALQEYYAKHAGTTINLRELHDALGEKFHRKGGIRHLYMLFPAGPVAQGCRIAGLKAPAGAVDRGFGSVA